MQWMKAEFSRRRMHEKFHERSHEKMEMEDPDPVSYTHLDVYKRQIQGYAEGLTEGMVEDPESRDYYCEVIQDEAGKMNKMAVSYTHLDVYKRQISW